LSVFRFENTPITLSAYVSALVQKPTSSDWAFTAGRWLPLLVAEVQRNTV